MTEIVVVEFNELKNLIQKTVEEMFIKYEHKKPPILINRNEVAKHLGVSPGTISAYVKNGKLTNHGVGKKILISEADLKNIRVRSYTRYPKHA